jgi:hypothetical protein
LQLNGKEVIFYLLMELQSTNCFQMSYRLLQYMAAIWRYYFKSHYTDDRKDFCLPAVMELFLNWFVTVVCRDLSKENKVEIIRELGKLHLEEAEKVVSNMAQTWRKMYDDALLAGKTEGKIEGEKLTAVKHAKSMLIKEMNEELIAEITGLTLVEIRKLRAETRILESKN